MNDTNPIFNHGLRFFDFWRFAQVDRFLRIRVINGGKPAIHGIRHDEADMLFTRNDIGMVDLFSHRAPPRNRDNSPKLVRRH